jgi:G:T-mismatch repair DNA endonuclease (very short patch repair protein)
MTDVFTRQKRSEIMSRIKGRGNLATELALVRLLRAQRLTGWRRHAALFGKPDFVFFKAPNCILCRRLLLAWMPVARLDAQNQSHVLEGQN